MDRWNGPLPGKLLSWVKGGIFTTIWNASLEVDHNKRKTLQKYITVKLNECEKCDHVYLLQKAKR